MFIVHVFVHVKPGCEEAFKHESRINSEKSLEEPGIARFDVIQQQGDPTQFVLVEVYRTPDGPARHKEAGHYKVWRDRVEVMMAEPRKSIKYSNIAPNDLGWG